MIYFQILVSLIAYDLAKTIFFSMVRVWVKSKNPKAYESALQDKKEAEYKWEKRYAEIMDTNN